MTENSIPQGTNLDDVDGKGVYMRPSTNPTSTNIVVNMAEEMGPEDDGAEASEDDDEASPADPKDARISHLESELDRTHVHRVESLARLHEAAEIERANQRTEWRLHEQQQAVIRAADLATQAVQVERRELVFWPVIVAAVVASVICLGLGYEVAHLVLAGVVALAVIADWCMQVYMLRVRARAVRTLNLVLHLIGREK